MRAARPTMVLLVCLIALASSVPGAQAHHATVPDVRADEAGSFALVRVNEGDYASGDGHCIFNFTYSTQDGSATAGEDYEAVSGEGRMEDGRGSFRIPLIDDDKKEDDETVSIVVVVTDPSEYYVVGFCQGSAPAERIDATMTIVDDETRPATGNRADPSSSGSGRAEASSELPHRAESQNRDVPSASTAAGGLITEPHGTALAPLATEEAAERPEIDRDAQRLATSAGVGSERNAGSTLAIAMAFVLALATGSATALWWRSWRRRSSDSEGAFEGEVES